MPSSIDNKSNVAHSMALLPSAAAVDGQSHDTDATERHGNAFFSSSKPRAVAQKALLSTAAMCLYLSAIALGMFLKSCKAAQDPASVGRVNEWEIAPQYASTQRAISSHQATEDSAIPEESDDIITKCKKDQASMGLVKKLARRMSDDDVAAEVRRRMLWDAILPCDTNNKLTAGAVLATMRDDVEEPPSVEVLRQRNTPGFGRAQYFPATLFSTRPVATKFDDWCANERRSLGDISVPSYPYKRSCCDEIRSAFEDSLNMGMYHYAVQHKNKCAPGTDLRAVMEDYFNIRINHIAPGELRIEAVPPQTTGSATASDQATDSSAGLRSTPVATTQEELSASGFYSSGDDDIGFGSGDDDIEDDHTLTYSSAEATTDENVSAAIARRADRAVSNCADSIVASVSYVAETFPAGGDVASACQFGLLVVTGVLMFVALILSCGSAMLRDRPSPSTTQDAEKAKPIEARPKTSLNGASRTQHSNAPVMPLNTFTSAC